jgi:hypothetical protein
MLVRRAARSFLQLELFDAKIASGVWTDVDGRVMGGVANNLRLTLRELGIKAAPPKRQSLTEYLATKPK